MRACSLPTAAIASLTRCSSVTSTTAWRPLSPLVKAVTSKVWTVAPAARRRAAVAAPMPDAPPVTRATRPV